MKKLIVIISFVLVCTVVGYAGLQTYFPVTVTNLSGKVYYDITLDHTDELGVIYFTTNKGVGLLKYTELTPDFINRYQIPFSIVDDARTKEEESKAAWAAKLQANAEGMARLRQQMAVAARQKAVIDASNAAALKVQQDEYNAAHAPLTEDQIQQAKKQGQLNAIAIKAKQNALNHP